jgi:uncharacterized membrane protein YphA (DoxX/SURF4 family)
MMQLLRNEWLALLFRLVLGGVFVYAAFDKIIHPEGFARAVYNYRLIPAVLINLFALFLPWLELFCGMALILGTRVDAAALILGGLLAVFIVAVSINLIRDVDIACGCFTSAPEGRKAGVDLLVQDTVLILMAFHLLFRGPGRWALDRACVESPIAP